MEELALPNYGVLKSVQYGRSAAVGCEDGFRSREGADGECICQHHKWMCEPVVCRRELEIKQGNELLLLLLIINEMFPCFDHEKCATPAHAGLRYLHWHGNAAMGLIFGLIK